MPQNKDPDELLKERNIRIPDASTYKIGTAKMPKHVLPCPFCGNLPEVRPYTNGKGASVTCNTLSCAMWSNTCDLEEWNRRSVSNSVKQLLFSIDSLYVSSDFHKKQLYVCRGCGATNYKMSKIRHKKHCCVKELLGDAP